MLFTRKKRSTPISGDIEMRSIPSAKKLGNKRPKSLSPNLSSRNASIGSVSAKRLRRFRANQIYSKRVRYSRCRGLAKTTCVNKRTCKFTKGKSRKYCRKKHNKRI
jgi:hypothetical protein